MRINAKNSLELHAKEFEEFIKKMKKNEKYSWKDLIKDSEK